MADQCKCWLKSLCCVALAGCLLLLPSWAICAWELSEVWIAGGGGPGQFRTPLDLALDDDGNIYVVDTGNDRIQVLSPQGQFLREWGRTGSGWGEFNQPRCISISDEVVYVGEGGPNCRVQRFSLMGEFLGRWGHCYEPGSLQAARGINVTGTLAHVASDNWVHRFNAANGALLNGLHSGPAPNDVWVAGDSTIWVSFEQSTVNHYDSNWQLLHSWSTLAPGDTYSVPRHIAVNDSGNIFVVETGAASDFLKEFTPAGVLRERVELRNPRTHDLYEGRGFAIAGDTIFIVSEFPDGILKYVRGLVPVEATTWGGIKARYRD